MHPGCRCDRSDHAAAADDGAFLNSVGRVWVSGGQLLRWGTLVGGGGIGGSVEKMDFLKWIFKNRLSVLLEYRGTSDP